MKLLVLFSVFLAAFTFAGEDQNMVSLGRVAQAVALTRVYAKPSTKAHVYYTVNPKEYMVVKDYRKDSPWKLVLLSNGNYAYGRSETMEVLDYEYKVPAPKAEPTLARMPRGTSLSSRSGDSLRAAVADYATKFKGITPYVFGGTNLATGADCSSFVEQMYGAIGVNLPRTAAQQVNVGLPVKRLEDLRKGDRLYFWDFKRNCVGHTGIYLGNGLFVHNSATHKGVDTDDLHNAKWLRILVAARR